MRRSGGGYSDLALTTPAVCRLAGVAPSTLDYWARTGLVSASVRGSSGRRVTRLWSVRDAVVVRAVKSLRDSGCPLQMLRRARNVIESEFSEAASATVLFWDGNDVLALTSTGDIASLVRKPGQLVIRVVALSLPPLLDEAASSAVPVAKLESRAGRKASGTIGARTG